MIRALLLAAALAACASAPSAPSVSDEAAISALVMAGRDRAAAAWEARDARILIPGDDGVTVMTPDGRPIDAAAMRADVQRRMDMTVSVEELSLDIVSVTITGDTAIAVSNQRFVRTINQPSGPRQRISTVTHTQRFARDADGWAEAGPIEESDQTARWADETPPG